jgi:tRNA G10  N-methylase Trm11
LQWGKFKPGDALLDPFCGSGTILLEAAETVGGKMTGVGCDSVAATVKGATGNAVIEGFENCLEFRKCNVVGYILLRPTEMSPQLHARWIVDAIEAPRCIRTDPLTTLPFLSIDAFSIAWLRG